MRLNLVRICPCKFLKIPSEGRERGREPAETILPVRARAFTDELHFKKHQRHEHMHICQDTAV